MTHRFTCPRCLRSDVPALRHVAVTVSPVEYRDMLACDHCIEQLRRESKHDPMVVIELLDEPEAA